MKKKIITSLFIIQTLFGSAQIWSNPGAEWHYGYVNYGPPVSHGYLKLNYVNDSLIGSVTYKKLKVTPYYAYTFGMFTNYSILLNENSKLITLFTGNIDTLFNFNATIGDKWLRVRIGSSSSDITRRYVTVIDTGHVIINSMSLKKLVLSYQHGGYATATVTNYLDTVYEKIGSVKQFLNPAETETTPLICDVSGYKVIANFRCYSDNTFALYQYSSALNCTAVVGIDENKLSFNNSLLIYPNPSNGDNSIHIEIGSEANAVLKITNVLGEVIYTKIINGGTTQLNVTGSELKISTGMYFVTLQEMNKMITQKLIIN